MDGDRRGHPGPGRGTHALRRAMGAPSDSRAVPDLLRSDAPRHARGVAGDVGGHAVVVRKHCCVSRRRRQGPGRRTVAPSLRTGATATSTAIRLPMTNRQNRMGVTFRGLSACCSPFRSPSRLRSPRSRFSPFQTSSASLPVCLSSPSTWRVYLLIARAAVNEDLRTHER